MRVLITGGSGMIGKAIIEELTRLGHDCSVLTRNRKLAGKKDHFFWNPDNNYLDKNALINQDAIIHLAGAGIAAKYWTKRRKRILYHSRIDSTKLLFSELEKRDNKPCRIISASAIGYYGNQPKKILCEEMEKGQGFLSYLCEDWEKVANFELLGISTVIVRIGIVLSNKGGSLPIFKIPFNFGLNILFGNGRQYLSWIHISDLVNGIIYLLSNQIAKGAFNMTAPQPVTQKEFNRQLAIKLGRRSLTINVAATILKLLLGELSSVILNDSQVLPCKLQLSDFKFLYPELGQALDNLLKKPNLMNRVNRVINS